MLTALLYAGAVAVGLRTPRMTFFPQPVAPARTLAWTAADLPPIANDTRSESIRRGELLFNETPIYAPRYARAQISCSNCHAEGGIQPYAAPMVGLTAIFPAYNRRAGGVISLGRRIQECFVRSENGRPPAEHAPEMQDLLNYIAWLSQPEPSRVPYVGRGLIHLPALAAATDRGASIYRSQCAGCHGSNGEGRAPLFPPLWGANSFNDGAGMHSVKKMAAFVQHNMPQNRAGLLSAQEAYDVSAYIHSQPRPIMDGTYKAL